MIAISRPKCFVLPVRLFVYPRTSQSSVTERNRTRKPCCR